MWTLLRPISLRRLAEHRLRSAMTAVGIALGVAVLIAVSTVNRSIAGSFSDTIERISGKVHVEVKGGDTGLDEALLDKVLAVPGVRFATPVVERTLDLADEPGAMVGLLGVNFTEDPQALKHLYDLDAAHLKREDGKDQGAIKTDFGDDPLALLDSPHQLVVTSAFAEKHGKKKGDPVDLMTPDGRQTFTIRSIVEAQGPMKAFGGSLAILDYMDAQEVFGLGHRVDRFDVAVADPQTPGRIDAVSAALKAALGGKYDVERPARRQERQEHLLRSFRLALAIGAGIALIVGMFLIYHTLSISVAQRRHEIGILRATGATRSQIVQLFTFEGALFGLVGSLLGVGLGALMARGMLRQSAASISEVYVRVHIDDVHLEPGLVGAGLALGVVCSALAALVPAWRASRLSPVETIRTVSLDLHPPPGLAWGLGEWAGVAIIAVSPAVARLPTVDGFPYFGLGAMFCVVLGATLLTRWCVVASHKVLGPLATRLFGIEGRLAADNVSRSAGKGAVTAASLMVGLSMVTGSSIMVHSFLASMDTWIAQSIPADLFVTAGAKLGGIQNQPLRPELANDIAQLPGVVGVDRIRLRNVDFRHTRILLLSLDVRIRFQHQTDWPMTRWVGDRKTVIARMQHGEGVIVAETLSHKFGLHPGDTLELASADGKLQLPILAAITDYSSDQGAVFMDRAFYMRHWHDDLVDTFEPYLVPGTDANQVRNEILRRWGAKYRLFVLTNQEFRDEIGRMIDRLFSVTRALEGVTLLISLLSVVNTLLTALLDRMREIGVLRAIGLLRGQLAKVILIESLCLALVGCALGVVVGIVNGWYIVTVVNRQDTGWVVPMQVPGGTVALYALALVVIGVVAAAYPARVAGRLKVVDALGYE
ncbi:MAG: FtsX-like permease family protein [Myxococcales bacterium]|nr:FtsX-like permease family protein [Myxococcales bacterium]